MSRSLADFATVHDRPAEAVNVADVARALVRGWRWIALPAAVAFAASVAFVLLVTPRYTAETKLLLESRDSFYTRPSQDRSSEQGQLIDEQAVASQVQVVMSRDLAREAIRRLGLVGNPEFDPLVDGVGPLRRLLMLFGVRSALDRAPEDRVLESYYERLLVYPQGKSRIITIEFRSRDPELAARAANTVAELYLELQEAAKKDMARTASTWLGGNIETLRERVAEAEAKVEAFRSRTGLLLGTNNATLTTQQLSELSGQLAQARTAQADADAKARMIRDLIKSGRTFEIPDVANNELIRRLTEQRVGLRAQIAFESRTLLSEHPRMKELSAQLSDLEAQIRGAAERTVRTLENDARITGARVETLQAAIEAQKKVASGANESEVQLRALEREARAHRDQLEAYLARYREATARDVANAMPPDARIVSRAVVPHKPSFPKRLPIVVLFTLAAAVTGAGALVARELMSERAAPVLASTPLAYAAPERPADTAASFPEALPVEEPVLSDERYDFDALIERLTSPDVHGRRRRILVTSLAGPENACDVARGLGHAVARHGRAVVLSFDAGEADLAEELGLTDLVAGEAGFAEVIEREPGSRLHRVPLGTIDAALLLQEPHGLDLALEAFDQSYDWVIALLQRPSADALLALAAARCDAVVVASEAEPTDEALVRLYDAAKSAGARDVVVVREREVAAAPVQGSELVAA